MASTADAYHRAVKLFATHTQGRAIPCTCTGKCQRQPIVTLSAIRKRRTRHRAGLMSEVRSRHQHACVIHDACSSNNNSVDPNCPRCGQVLVPQTLEHWLDCPGTLQARPVIFVLYQHSHVFRATPSHWQDVLRGGLVRTPASSSSSSSSAAAAATTTINSRSRLSGLSAVSDH